MLATIDTTLFSDNKICESSEISHFVPDKENQETHVVNLYPDAAYQTIDTFGGAITESVGVTLQKMTAEQREQIFNAYFGKDGIGYRAIRAPIDSCDFSLKSYSAVERPDDTELSTFALKHDEKNIIPYILAAYRTAGASLPVMLSPWSPPAFMKTNQSRYGGRLKREFYPLWANYICRYIREYRMRGIHVKMLSIQNEPNAEQKWDSCLFPASEERDFLKDALVPALDKAGLNDIELYIWDHNKERIYERAREVITPETDPMIHGIAFHWYSGDHFDALRLVHEKYPGKKLLFSEGCIEYSRHSANRQLENAQIYAHDMIGNLNAGMNTFFDWNLVLDEMGGPNHAGNYCEAPIIYDTKSQMVKKNLSFYYIRHFSKHILPGAQRIATTCYSDQLEVTAFRNSNQTLAAVLLNRSSKNLPAVLRLHNQLLKISVKRRSLCTITIAADDETRPFEVPC